jgi:hypothetical protein
MVGIIAFALIGCQFEVESEDGEHSNDTAPRDDGGWDDTPADGDGWVSPVQPSSTPSIPAVPTRPVDPLRELVIVDPAVVNSADASNAVEGAPWSFRSSMEWLSGDERTALALVRDWLGEWEHVTYVGPFDAPVTPRPAVNTLLIGPWLSLGPATPPPGSSPDQYYAPEPRPKVSEEPAWNRAPFALIAIVNRVDLRSEPCSGSAGELRFVYTAIEPSSRAPLEMTLIVEIPYAPTKTPAEWAKAWHALPELGSGATYRAALARLTNEVLADADPFSARVRSNEVALGAADGLPWELREFRLDDGEFGRRLVMVPFESTPRKDADPKLLGAHIVGHAEDVLDRAVPLPEALRGATAQVAQASFTWAVPSVDDSLRRAFSRQTCNGCHGGDAAALPFQHIAPDPIPGRPARLSRFLRDPSAPSDELRRRARALEALLVTRCDGSDEEPYR